MFNIENIIRPHLKALVPYSSARSEFKGVAKVLMDANESPFDTLLNRYPDPNQNELKALVSKMESVKASQIFIGNGSDEIIDLLLRAFCEPGKDKAYVFTPTYGMYEVSAQINCIDVVKFELTKQFDLPELSEIKNGLDSNGIIFICSPNNPTGNLYELEKIQNIANAFSGLVVVDEAYIDFSNAESSISLLDQLPNLVVLQTMSKSYGLAGIRLGLAFTNPEVINVLNKIKPPYNINTLTQVKAIKALKDVETIRHQIREIQMLRDTLTDALKALKIVKEVYPSAANFVLVEFVNANRVYDELRDQGIILRNKSREIENCLRISIGTNKQNTILISALQKLSI